MRFRALLWAVRHGQPVPPLPAGRGLAKPLEIDPVLPGSFYAAVGLRVLNGLAVRPDRLERLAAAARRLARGGPFAATPPLAALAGAEPPALRRLLSALGYRAVIDGDTVTFVARQRRQRQIRDSVRRRGPTGEGHPFAKLRELKLA
jgi:ATP-dependent RNA helicase SUPV3L1/SUV3